MQSLSIAVPTHPAQSAVRGNPSGALMASKRRLGQENSATRDAILEAAAKVIVEEGVTALTSRRVSQRAGVKSQLVHYYFRTMSDLVVAVIRRAGDEALKAAVRAAASLEPLRELWDLESKARASVVYSELAALAAHDEKLREEIVRYAEQGRAFQAEAIAQHFKVLGLEAPMHPLAAAFFMSAAARLMVRERASGMSLGHAEALAVIEQWLSSLAGKGGLRRDPASAENTSVDRRPRAQGSRKGRSKRATKSN